MRHLQEDSERMRLGANARAAALGLSPAAITLKLVLLYRDLLAATATAKAQSIRGAGTAGSAGAGHAVVSSVRGAAMTQHSAMDLVPPKSLAPRGATTVAREMPMDDGKPPPPVLEWRVDPDAAPPEVARSLTLEIARPSRSSRDPPHGSNRG